QAKNTTGRDIENAWRHLDKQLQIKIPKEPDAFEVSVSLEGTEPARIANWANIFVELANSAARQELIETLTGEVTIREQSLREQIATLREVAEKQRQDRKARLEAALTIAESIGLEDPVDGAPFISINTEHRSEGLNGGSLIYLRGAKAIRAELVELEKRTSYDAFIPELPDLLKRLALIKSINLRP